MAFSFFPFTVLHPSGIIFPHKKAGSAVTILWFAQDTEFWLSPPYALFSFDWVSEPSFVYFWKPSVSAVVVWFSWSDCTHGHQRETL